MPRAGDVRGAAVARLVEAKRAVVRSFLRRANADGSIPSEPVSCAASSLRMSPNKFSVTIVSNDCGRRTKSIAVASTSWCDSSTCGYSAASCVTVSRQRRDVSSTLALSTLKSLRPRFSAVSKPTRAMRVISPFGINACVHGPVAVPLFRLPRNRGRRSARGPPECQSRLPPNQAARGQAAASDAYKTQGRKLAYSSSF